MTYRTKDEIGRQILALRREAGITQRQLADAMRVDASAMSRVEAGQRALAIDELALAADFLGVTVDDLLRQPAPPFESETGSGDDEIEDAIARMRGVIDSWETFCSASPS